MKHEHADILQAIIDKKVVQCQCGSGWRDADERDVLYMLAYQMHNSTLRVKPDTIEIAGIEVAKPMTKAPVYDTEYYSIDSMVSDGVIKMLWSDDSYDATVLASGMCWLNKQDALNAVAAIKLALEGKTA